MADPDGKADFSVAQVRHRARRNWQLDFIDVAPGPAFAWLEGRDHGVARLMEMSRGVAPRRTIATADVTTAQTEPQMNPRRAQFQALFTPWSAGRSRFDTPQMLTVHDDPPEKQPVAAAASKSRLEPHHNTTSYGN
jgi:hypothetical protein